MGQFLNQKLVITNFVLMVCPSSLQSFPSLAHHIITTHLLSSTLLSPPLFSILFSSPLLPSLVLASTLLPFPLSSSPLLSSQHLSSQLQVRFAFWSASLKVNFYESSEDLAKQDCNITRKQKDSVREAAESEMSFIKVPPAL